MKKLLLGASASILLLLAACGETNKESADESIKDEVNVEEEEKAEKTSETEKYNKVVMDDEVAKITLVSITRIQNSWGKEVRVQFDVENKHSDTIVIQSEEVSSDGRMIEHSLVSMSDEIAVGKTGFATLHIDEFEGYEFPELESDLELKLNVFTWDFEYDELIPVKVDLKSGK